MKYAHNNNGILQDVIMTDPFIIFDKGYAATFIEVPDDAQSGCLWDGEALTAPPAPPAPIPQSVTMRQARLALLAAGKLAGVTAAINALPSPQKEAAQIEWEYSQTVERNRGFVLLLGAALGLDDAQLDGLFVVAAGL